MDSILQITNRMDTLRMMLRNPGNDNIPARSDLQAEYRMLERKLRALLEGNRIEVIYLPESQTLLWRLDGAFRAAISGPMAEERYHKIKSFIEITLKTENDDIQI